MTTIVAPDPVAAAPSGQRTLDTHWQTRTVAALLLGLAAVGIWRPQLGGGVLWALPVLAFAILVMVRAIEPASKVQSLLLMYSWVLWIPLAVLLAGAPPSAMAPNQLIVGLVTLVRGAAGPAALASWLAFTGTFWILGAAQSVRPGRGSAAAAFVFLTLPFVSAFAVSRTGDAAWYGGALLGAALLWATRGTLRGGLVAVAAVALIGTVVAAAIGPTERKIPQRAAHLPTGGIGGIGENNDGETGQGQAGNNQQQQGSQGQTQGSAMLDTSQNYDKINEDGEVVVSFEVRAPEPALWRMQVLDSWDGRGWAVGATAGPQLPQPAAHRMRMTVTPRALRDLRVIGAGRIVSVPGGPKKTAIPGEAYTFGASPPIGSSYEVVSEVVPTDIAAIQRIPLPAAANYTAETQIWPDLPATIPLSERIAQLPPDVARSEWGQVYKTALTLSQGEVTQFGVVRNVLDYLRDPAKFSYSLNVKPPGPQPLVTFLTDTHVGYCQHFAGSAALLLRLAGVPTRVVSGFATGEQSGDRYVVHSTDPHAWIEVYFEGYGWVPFNPTPGDAAAQVAPSVDPTAPPKSASIGHLNFRQMAELVLVLLAIACAVMAWRRWRRRAGAGVALSELLLRVVPSPSGPGTTVRSLAGELERIGPQTAALGASVERERFAPGVAADDRRPRWRLWLAMRGDVGAIRATWLLAFGAPRPEARGDGTRGAAPLVARETLGESASVAPPGGFGSA